MSGIEIPLLGALCAAAIKALFNLIPVVVRELGTEYARQLNLVNSTLRSVISYPLSTRMPSIVRADLETQVYELTRQMLNFEWELDQLQSNKWKKFSSSIAKLFGGKQTRLGEIRRQAKVVEEAYSR